MRILPDTLRRARAFAALPAPALEALALCFSARRYPAGGVVFREGDPATGLLFVVEGELAATARMGGATVPLRSIEAGQLLGEAALIDPSPRQATVKAVRRSTVYEIGEDAVEILRRNAPEAARALVGAAVAGVTRRLRLLEQRLEQDLERGVSLP
jgi:CRP-like cAMP-binding protein